MYRKNLNRGWEFMQGEPSSIPGMPKETKTVNLPHDFMVEQDVTADAKGGAGGRFLQRRRGNLHKNAGVFGGRARGCDGTGV